jgi:DNA-binding XRE family transcriptional regulator
MPNQLSTLRRTPFYEVRNIPRAVTSQNDKRIGAIAHQNRFAHRWAPIKARPVADINCRFGIRLRELRKSRNLTQLRMAEDFGIDRSFISEVERGRKSISLTSLELIAVGLNLNLSDLLRDL